MKRRIPPLRHLRYLAEAAAAYAAVAPLRLVPVGVASAIGGAVARGLGPLLPATRRARRTLAVAFPDLDRRERRRIIRGMWDNLGRVAGEAIHVRKLWDSDAVAVARGTSVRDIVRAAREGRPVTLKTPRLEIRGVENFVRFLAAEGPAIVFTAHLGNWELLPVAAADFGVFISVVFRTPNNPYVARLVERLRSGTVALLPKGFEGAAAAGRVMRDGGRLGMLVDQKQNRGIAVDFFGRPAMTGTTLAKLALRFDCPIFGAWVQRVSGRDFVVTVTPPLDVARTGDEDTDVEAITRRVNEVVEGWVRERPDQWLWIHRRWPDS